MRASFVAIVALFAAVTSAAMIPEARDDHSHWPDCVKPCLHGTPDTHCKEGDWKCLCTSHGYLQDLRECIHDKCRGHDVDDALKHLDDKCH